jgi:hypothetical protein
MMTNRKSIARTVLTVFLTTFGFLLLSGGAQAQDDNQRVINTSRSNIKNNKTRGNWFDPLVFNLRNAAGEKVAAFKLADTDGDGKLSDSESAYDFGVLPAGEYTLTIIAGGDFDLASVGAKKQSGAVNTSKLPADITITLDGAVGGKKEYKQKLEVAGQESKAFAPGQVNYGTLNLTTDGKTTVKMHYTLKPIIQNIK